MTLPRECPTCGAKTEEEAQTKCHTGSDTDCPMTEVDDWEEMLDRVQQWDD